VKPKKRRTQEEIDTELDLKRNTFHEVLYDPALINNKVVVITKGMRLYFISEHSGQLICHSRTTLDNFKIEATKKMDSWYRNVLLKMEYTEEKNTYNPVMKTLNLRLSDFQWFSPVKRSGMLTSEAKSRYPVKSSKIAGIYSIKNFKLNFKIKLTGEPVPGGKSPVRIRKVRLTTQNVLLMFHSKHMDRALYYFGKARYGSSDLPWEFEVVKTEKGGSE
jgi:hypothetical protein